MAKDFAIVLNNGTINSAVATALAVQKFRPIMLHAESAQSPGPRQRAAFDQQVTHFKPYREISISLPIMTATNPDAANSVADPRAATPLAMRLTELTPLIAIALRYSQTYQAAAIYVGLCVGPEGADLAKATEYFQIWNELIQLPCELTDVEVVAPLLELEPWQVVDVGFQVGVPFERTWSCLQDATDPCWACRGCRARESAFVQAAKPDPLRAAKRA
jgi:Queuosine biosynthesis protein QueC